MTTGLEQYAPGGAARLKALIIGGPGAGKTREASYWPSPIYGDCEGGLASIADRQMPYVSIRSSQDMLDFLAYLKVECRKPDDARIHHTVVIDTLDAFQRKVKDEWLQANPNAGSFKGYDAWGYLDAKMQMLMTRLLNLDMNVIVNVHYKDKTIKEGTGENASERQELMLQLQGDIKDNAFNDFDLVGWMGSYFEAVDGQRVKKRGLTFTDTPEKPFLKDRLFITPKWMEVTFSDADYIALFSKLTERLSEMEAGKEIGEIESAGTFDNTPTGGVVAPGASGALPPVDPREIPLAQYDKPTLVKKARDLATELGVEITIKGNTIKAEVLRIVEDLQAQKKAKDEVPTEPEAPAAEAPAEGTPVVDPTTEATPTPEPAVEPSTVAETTPVVEEATPAPLESLVDTEVGPVDSATGEISEDQAVAAVVEGLGGEVVSQDEVVEVKESPAPPAPTTAAPAGTCAECGKDLAGENANFVRLSFIKFKKHLCEDDYKARKKAA